jgi:hypothetical protein
MADWDDWDERHHWDSQREQEIRGLLDQPHIADPLPSRVEPLGTIRSRMITVREVQVAPGVWIRYEEVDHFGREADTPADQ